MGYVEGLAKLDEELSKQGEFSGDREKARWVTLKKDGDSVKLTPLQEFDEGSPNYSAKNGLARTYLEHSNPENFKLQAECTADQASCYGCENGWKQKRVLYINVLVDDGQEEPYVAILSRGFGKSGPANTLKTIASDEDFGFSVSDKTFKYTKSGDGKNTSYDLSVLPKPANVKVEDYEMWDLSQAVFHVDPEKQERYYTTGRIKEEGSAEAKTAPTAQKVDVDW